MSPSISTSFAMEAGIGSCVGAAGVVAAWGAGNDAAIVAAMEVAIVVVLVLSSSLAESLEAAECASQLSSCIWEISFFADSNLDLIMIMVTF
jgi:hypothetical protein